MTRRRRNRKKLNAAVDALATTIERDESFAKIGPGQVFVSEKIAKGTGKGEATRYRNVGEHPLTLAWTRKKISDEEYAAGDLYRGLCEKLGRSGKDSTVVGVPGGGSGMFWSQVQADANKALEKIDAKIGQDNRMILRKFCGDGASMIEAVCRYVPSHPSNVAWRIREALSCLARALRDMQVRPAA